jgi:hypothetical protein
VSRATRVECYSGTRYAERPLSFSLSDRIYTVKVVEKSWRRPSSLHFRVRTEDDEIFELAYNTTTDDWKVVKGGKL